MRSLVLSALLVLPVFGCRDGGGDNDGRDGGGDAPTGGMTIQEIQMPPGPGIGSPVTLHGVVVTAVDRYGARQGTFYVQEPEGGPYSGIAVFTGNTSAVASLQPGDVVSITEAVVDEFNYSADTTGRKLTEVADPTGGMMTIQKTGTASVPDPDVVDPRVLSASADEVEKWEGVLVRFENVSVTDAPDPVSMTDPTLKEMKVTGPFAVGSGLTELADPPAIANDDCFASLTGVVDYFYAFSTPPRTAGDGYRLLPRSASDLAANGTACPAPEALCTDTMDNDGDGFVDCQDRSCQQTEPACTLDATIPDVQMQTGKFVLNTRVRITDAIVTAVAASVFWIQEDHANPGANPWTGVQVFATMTPEMLGIQPGDTVTIEGTIEEYFDVTELSDATLVDRTAGTTGDIPAPVSRAFSDFVDSATAEQWEGMLVRVEDVSVLSVPDANGEWIVGSSGTPATMGLSIDDYMVDPTPDGTGTNDLPTAPVMGGCYNSITGPLHFSFEKFKIEPRLVSDVVAGAGCP